MAQGRSHRIKDLNNICGRFIYGPYMASPFTAETTEVEYFSYRVLEVHKRNFWGSQAVVGLGLGGAEARQKRGAL